MVSHNLFMKKNPERTTETQPKLEIYREDARNSKGTELKLGRSIEAFPFVQSTVCSLCQILIVKLSSIIHIEQTIHATWMDLVHKYFQDLLLQSISGNKSDQDKFLEGSPFCTSIFDPGKQYTSSRHLQRLTVFLFLKCSLNLISTNGRPDEPQCAYPNLKHNCTSNLDSDSECRSESIGLVKIHEWLKAHVDADIIENGELYYDGCVRFTLSFMQLFMHEDDILFKMLLLLFRIPFYPDRWTIKDEPRAEVEIHLTFLPSDLFNPAHIFHIFLAEVVCCATVYRGSAVVNRE